MEPYNVVLSFHQLVESVEGLAELAYAYPKSEAECRDCLQGFQMCAEVLGGRVRREGCLPRALVWGMDSDAVFSWSGGDTSADAMRDGTNKWGVSLPEGCWAAWAAGCSWVPTRSAMGIDW